MTMACSTGTSSSDNLPQLAWSSQLQRNGSLYSMPTEVKVSVGSPSANSPAWSTQSSLRPAPRRFRKPGTRWTLTTTTCYMRKSSCSTLLPLVWSHEIEPHKMPKLDCDSVSSSDYNHYIADSLYVNI